MDAVTTLPLADQIRAYVAENNFNHNDRLPAERDLSLRFGVSRGELRSTSQPLPKADAGVSDSGRWASATKSAC